MARIISGSNTSRITLGSGDNPVSVTGTINVANDGALVGPGGVGDNTWTIANAGLIHSGDGNGISLGEPSTLVASGIITNQTGGTISGTNYGIDIFGAGSVTNQSGATILGSDPTSFSSVGIRLSGAPGAVVNDGLISADIVGVSETAGGTVINNTGGTIQAYSSGVYIAGGSGTVTNAGAISGTGKNSDAVRFAPADPSNLLIVDPGAVFEGNINGGTGAVELASGAGPGVLSGFGTSITNFTTVEFDPGASWTIAGNDFSTTTIDGFDSDDTIDLTGFVATGSPAFDSKTHDLVLPGAGPDATLSIQGSFTSSNFFLDTASHGGDTIITTDATCYRRGTRILTPSGEIPIEQLAIGDPVITRSGEAKPIRWIGRRSYAGRSIAGNRDVLPIRIAANALADGLPTRDLDVSPGHAMLIDGVLIEARNLVNGISIHQLEAVDSIEYLHIELEAPDAIFAEGAAAETYVECDNRGNYQNAAEFDRLYPNADVQKWTWCAPRIDAGDVLVSVRRRLDERLDALGYARSSDPALRLLVDGCETLPDAIDGCTYVFRLPQQPTDVRIVSRASIPAGITESHDTRRLGIALSGLVVASAHSTINVAHDHPALTDGFHKAEAAHRWTDGNARIPEQFLASFGQSLTIKVRRLDLGLPYRNGVACGVEFEGSNNWIRRLWRPVHGCIIAER